jgi:uncharacterized Zn finger protein
MEPGANANWALAQTIKCEECGHDIFVSGVYLQKLSKLVAMTDKDMVRPVPTFSCAKCGHVNQDFRPIKTSVSPPKQQEQGS